MYYIDGIRKRWKKRYGGYHYPGYNYLGPGTDLSKNRKPINSLDRAAYVHDWDYNKLSKRYGSKIYTHYSRADDRFLKSIRNERGPAAGIARTLFTGKKWLAPRMPGYKNTRLDGRPKGPMRFRRKGLGKYAKRRPRRVRYSFTSPIVHK